MNAHTTTDSGFLHGQYCTDTIVHRVGYTPDPWRWTPWHYADNGRFAGRWDDPDGLWRTLYVGQTRLACYLEVLAHFRPDPVLGAELDQIVDDAPENHPTAPPGTVPASWCTPRTVATATMTGWFARPGHHESLPTLRARFLTHAITLGFADLDAAAIRDSRPRTLTRAISAWIYRQATPEGHPITGISFDSRHGDALQLWAIYERDSNTDTPAALHPAGQPQPVDATDPDFIEALRLHRVTLNTE